MWQMHTEPRLIPTLVCQPISDSCFAPDISLNAEHLDPFPGLLDHGLRMLVPMLEDCFHSTDWDVFRGCGALTRESLDEYTTAVVDYINFCVDSVTSWRQIRVFPNQKPWMTHKVRLLIKARDIAFRPGDSSAYSTARAALRRGIKSTKLDYRKSD